MLTSPFKISMAREGSSKKRNRARIPKEERKNLRLWAEGNREVVLNPYLADYAAAMDRGTAAERKLWKKICREYHARISWRLHDHEEPVLLPWDPEAPIAAENLPADEEACRLARIEELNNVSVIIMLVAVLTYIGTSAYSALVSLSNSTNPKVPSLNLP
jgi:hypothetical protein